MVVLLWFPLRFRLASLFGGVAIAGLPVLQYMAPHSYTQGYTDWTWLVVFIFKAKKVQDVKSERRHVE